MRSNVSGCVRRETIKHFESRIREKRYANEAVEYYGYIYALLRDKKYQKADEILTHLYEILNKGTSNIPLEEHQIGKTIQVKQPHVLAGAMIETLTAKVLLKAEKTLDALEIYRSALKIYPQHRALMHGYADALLHNQQADIALEFINKKLRYIYNDVHLYQLQARSYAALGEYMLQHQAQAEVYIGQGNYPAAVRQLKTALRHDNGNFYQLSSVEARLKQLDALMAADED